MQRLKIVLKLLALALAVYLLLRILFAWAYFSGEHFSFSEYLQVFYWGTRLDFSAVFYINIPFFLFYFFIGFFPASWQYRMSLISFSLINLPFIALNFIDLVYYRYTLRRSTTDLFFVFEDSMDSFSSLFRQYWFVLLGFLIVSAVFVWVASRIIRGYLPGHSEKWYLKWGMPVLFLAVGLLIARGGGPRPIIPATALLHANPAAQPLVNNSTLNMLYSYLRFRTRPERKEYFTREQLDSIFTIRRQYKHDSFEKRNVVVFILESFNASYFLPGADRARTPFFDSLMNKSTVCANAFANGHESVKGIMAIMGSMPPFLDEPLFISNYNSVPFKGIGSILKEEGYNTSFFMGAEYDHFNFAKLCRMVGIDEYYSKEDYGQPGQEDGNWGLFDEYFFSYFANVLSQKKQPFFSTLFNLSSHPPFILPDEQKNRFTIPGQSAQLNSITYVDHCFRQLFEEIKKQDWFSNTLFVFCSDHTIPGNISDRSTQYQSFHIPLFVYDPQQQEKIVVQHTVQQLDIIPSILDRLGYSKPFMSFGNSFYENDSTRNWFSICRRNDGYQLISDSLVTGFDERSEKTLYHYNYRNDPFLSADLSGKDDTVLRKQVDMIKAFLQRFNNSLLDHQLLITD